MVVGGNLGGSVVGGEQDKSENKINVVLTNNDNLDAVCIHIYSVVHLQNTQARVSKISLQDCFAEFLNCAEYPKLSC